MKWKKVWNILCFLGIPWIPLISAALYYLSRKFGAIDAPLFPVDMEALRKTLGYALLGSFLICCKNMMWIGVSVG